MAQHVVVGPPGVCLLVTLSPDLTYWYKMENPPPPMPACNPHITLLVNPTHTAKDLGPFARQTMMTYDWQPKATPGLLFSPSTQTHKITTDELSLTGIFEHVMLQRHHGRETTDSDLAEQMLNTLPDSLWSQGPTDVGLLKVPAVTFLHRSEPVWHAQ